MKTRAVIPNLNILVSKGAWVNLIADDTIIRANIAGYYVTKIKSRSVGLFMGVFYRFLCRYVPRNTFKVLATTATLVASCESIPIFDRGPDPSVRDKFYKRTLVMEINGKRCVGACVVPKALTYKITLKFDAFVDRIRWNTCHSFNHIVTRTKEYKFTYSPVPELESRKSCLLAIEGLSHHANHQWGILEFEGYEGLTIPATLYCDGAYEKPTGVGICQSLQGLTQRIIFKQAMEVVHPERCPKPRQVDRGFTWDFDTGPNYCIYRFYDKRHYKQFRLITVGFDEVWDKEVLK